MVRTGVLTLNVINLEDILSVNHCEDISSFSDFSWGDLDVSMVKLDNLISVCEKHHIFIDHSIRKMTKDRNVTWYVDLDNLTKVE